MVQGEFEPINDHEMTFIGQAKKRTGDDAGRRIYCLCDPKIFIERLGILRNSSAAADLVDLVNNVPESETRSGNAMVNTRISVAFNPFVKDFLTTIAGFIKTAGPFMPVSFMSNISIQIHAGKTATKTFSLRFSATMMRTHSCITNSLSYAIFQQHGVQRLALITRGWWPCKH